MAAGWSWGLAYWFIEAVDVGIWLKLCGCIAGGCGATGGRVGTMGAAAGGAIGGGGPMGGGG